MAPTVLHQVPPRRDVERRLCLIPRNVRYNVFPLYAPVPIIKPLQDETDLGKMM